MRRRRAQQTSGSIERSCNETAKTHYRGGNGIRVYSSQQHGALVQESDGQGPHQSSGRASELLGSEHTMHGQKMGADQLPANLLGPTSCVGTTSLAPSFPVLAGRQPAVVLYHRAPIHVSLGRDRPCSHVGPCSTLRPSVRRRVRSHATYVRHDALFCRLACVTASA